VFNGDPEKISERIRSKDIGLAPIAESFVQRYDRYVPKSLKLALEAPNEKRSAGQLFFDVYSAKKGKPRPRSLWPIINLILVDWDGSMFRRAGVGKVIMKAWLEVWSPPREVIFA
jgi:hypothetical protein